MSSPARSGFFEGVTPTVTIVSLLVVLLMAALGAFAAEPFEAFLDGARSLTAPFMASYYVALVSVVLVYVIWLGTGRYKNVRLGGDEERPEFSTFSWITMLFAAGMGVGLIFWSVAEPLSHLQGNPFLPAEGARTDADVAMRLTLFHWGLHGWALFSLVAIVIGYFGFRHRLPLSMRSALYPLLGRGVFGAPGDAMDTFTVVATVFGIVTTVGLGVQQLAAGLDELTALSASSTLQVVIVALLMAVSTGALLIGFQSGLRVLSSVNFWLSVALVGIFLFVGPTAYLLALAVQASGDYLQSLMVQSFWTGAHDDSGWHAAWTVFYWSWWMAWSPFVGLFIARISRGRKLREFVMGVLLAPVIISFVWLTVLGGTALHLEREAGAGISAVVQDNIAAAFYHTLAALDPGMLGLAAAVLVTVLIAIYLITSASAGVLVINTLLAFGAEHHGRHHIALWGFAIAVLTAVLLSVGGVSVLQDAVVMASLPFSFALVAMMIGLTRALEEEVYGPRKGRRSCLPSEPWVQGSDPT